jgi:hypothetical protein
MELSTAADIAAAFDTVDALLEQATDAAPAVALLLERARQQGVSEHQLAANLRATTPVLRWLMRLAPDATANRIDLDGADVGALLLKWARAAK